MNFSVFSNMQDAVDIIQQSPHPTNKISATLAGTNSNDEPFRISRTNYWPAPIKDILGTDTKIGNSSGTIHAETACILAAERTRNASIFVTDLPCPNCIKNIVEAGIKALYIDHKGFAKDYAIRRGAHFEHMSLRMCEKAGISVYKLWRKEERIEPLLEVPESYVPPLEKPALAENIGKDIAPPRFEDYIAIRKKHYGSAPFAMAVAKNIRGENIILSAESHAILGYTEDTLDPVDSKYSFMLEPLNRLLMTAARKGLNIDSAYLYSSRTPTSRELVNMIGAGLNHITIGDKEKARDEHGLQALERLIDAQILNVED